MAVFFSRYDEPERLTTTMLSRDLTTMQLTRLSEPGHPEMQSSDRIFERIAPGLVTDSGAFGDSRRAFFQTVASTGERIASLARTAFPDRREQFERLRQRWGVPDTRDLVFDDEAHALAVHERLAVYRTGVIVEQVLPHVNTAGRNLEIGSGYGELAARMRGRMQPGGVYMSADIGDPDDAASRLGAYKPWCPKQDYYPFRPGRLADDLPHARGLDSVVAVSVLHHVLPADTYAALDVVRRVERGEIDPSEPGFVARFPESERASAAVFQRALALFVPSPPALSDQVERWEQFPDEAYHSMIRVLTEPRAAQDPGGLQRAYLKCRGEAAQQAAGALLQQVYAMLAPGGRLVAVEDYIGTDRADPMLQYYVDQHDLAICPDYQGVGRTVGEWAAVAEAHGLRLERAEPFYNLSEAGHPWQHVALVFRKPGAGVSSPAVQ